MNQLEKILEGRILLLISTLNLKNAMLLTKHQVTGLIKEIARYNETYFTKFKVENITFSQAPMKDGFTEMTGFSIEIDSIKESLTHDESILLIKEEQRLEQAAA